MNLFPLLPVSRHCLPILIAAGVAAGCESAGESQPLSIEGVGAISGVVYRDTNANGSFDSGEKRVGNVTVNLQPWRADFVAAVTRTDKRGVYRVSRVAVGSYRVVPDRSVLGDTLEVVPGTRNYVTVEDGGTAAVNVGLRRR